MKAEDLKAFRDEKGWTQLGLAWCMGVDQATISRWESGTTPIPRWAERLIQYVRKIYG